MKFRDIVETPEYMRNYDYEKFNPGDERFTGTAPGWESHGQLETGHHLYKREMPTHGESGDKHVLFVATGQHDHKKSIKVSGTVYKSAPTEFHVGNLDSYVGNTLKAHDLYHHIVSHHYDMVSDSAQSGGGKKTWQRLAEKPGISMSARKPVYAPGQTSIMPNVNGGEKRIEPHEMHSFYSNMDAMNPEPKNYTRFVARKAPMNMGEAFKIEPYMNSKDSLYVAHGNVRGHRVRVDFSKNDDRDYTAMFRVYNKNGIPTASRGAVDDKGSSIHIAHAVAGTVKSFVDLHRPKALRFSPLDDDWDVKQKKNDKYIKLAKHIAKHFNGTYSPDHASGEEDAHKITFRESMAVELAEVITDWETKPNGFIYGRAKVGPHKVSVDMTPNPYVPGHYSASFTVNHNITKKNYLGHPIHGTPDPVHAMAIAHTVAASVDHFVQHVRPRSLSFTAYDDDEDIKNKKTSKYGKLANYLAAAHNGRVEVDHDDMLDAPKHVVHFPGHE